MQRGDEAARHPLVSISRLRILDALQDTGPLTLIDLAERIGLHVNTIREHLTPLIDDGYVAVDTEPPRGRGRPRSRYRAIEGVQMRDHLRALRRLERLDRRAREAGLAERSAEPTHARDESVAGKHAQRIPSHRDAEATPGPAPEQPNVRELHQRALLEQHMDELGFDPSPADTPDSVRLVPCVARELADSHDRIMCRVHERLIGDLLDCVDGPLQLGALRPFANEHGCRLDLRRSG